MDMEEARLYPYAYTRHNPLRYADPDGRRAFDMFDVPDKKCCSADAVQQATGSVDYQIDRMMNGLTPHGTVAAFTVSSVICDSDGLCRNARRPEKLRFPSRLLIGSVCELLCQLP
jgi:hypothetical protein